MKKGFRKNAKTKMKNTPVAKKVTTKELYNNLANIMRKHLKKKQKPTFKRYGIVLSIQDGIILASGLKTVGLTEVVELKKKLKGMVSTLERDYVRICLMGPEKGVQPGDVITRTKKFITVPVGFPLLGRVVNSLGQPIDGKGALRQYKANKFNFKRLKNAFKIYSERKQFKSFNYRQIKDLKAPTKIKSTNKTTAPVKQLKKKGKFKFYKVNAKRPMNIIKAVLGIANHWKLNNVQNKRLNLKTLKIERSAPGIMARKSIHEPLITGTKVVDGVIPIGRGQRELILGDRNTGKTTIAVDAIISQTRHNKFNVNDKIYSVYVAVGQRQAKVQDVVNTLKKHDALKHTVIVFAPSYAPAILQFIAPYTGTTIGEYFRDKGHHALVIYDDLTKHAQIHRQLSLLLKTPPGREAYPGDVFYVHARLLERSAKLAVKKGAGSLTALPVIETFDNDATSYIPTNVISITDGQIYLRQDLFFSGIKPAVNINFSVSRVGSAAQIETMQQICGRLKLQIALYNDYKIFARFTNDLDPSIKQLLVRGDRLIELFKQKSNVPLPVQKQILSLYSGMKGFLDLLPLSSVADYERKLHLFAETEALWYPYYLMLEDEIDELIVNTFIASFIMCRYT